MSSENPSHMKNNPNIHIHVNTSTSYNTNTNTNTNTNINIHINIKTPVSRPPPKSTTTPSPKPTHGNGKVDQTLGVVVGKRHVKRVQLLQHLRRDRVQPHRRERPAVDPALLVAYPAVVTSVAGMR